MVVLYVLTVTLLVRCQTDLWQEESVDMLPGSGPRGYACSRVHPLRVEVVAWASCQPYLLCALFSMLAVIAYLERVREGMHTPGGFGWRRRLRTLRCGGCCPHAIAVSLPAVLVILDLSTPPGDLGTPPRGDGLAWLHGGMWREKVPFMLGELLVFTGLAGTARNFECAFSP